MHCLYAPDLHDQTQFTLSESESHHLINVLRAKSGDQIIITNGNGRLFEAVIAVAHKKHTTVDIIATSNFTRTQGSIHLVIAPVKTAERLGYLLEKITELNVSSITPILTQNGERRVFHHEKEIHHLIAAIKQSKNPFLPILYPLTTFEKLLTDLQQNVAQKLICHCRNTPKMKLTQQYQPKQDVIICIGPEGDFTTEEVAAAEQAGFTSVSLGNEVLRAETAGIVAAVTIKTVNALS
ncbi:MAG TPA: RsmE family RNA methyltransferase [Chitinophagales bacterium]|nr:RsmE family RNA methyltransferase [Chitinophagales bacterium]HRG84303.1 RsmE family RNA methyltransferase [Chitinophagales bacterium]HRH52076.1 RsmE family RNA methyltransferase [Chitinophagales bacterium]